MTPQQDRLYSWLLDRADNPVAPTFEEMRKAMGYKSKSGIARILDSLHEQGRIERRPNRAQSVRAIRRDGLGQAKTFELIAELKRRGEWPDAR
jgi:repressor LexA